MGRNDLKRFLPWEAALEYWIHLSKAGETPGASEGRAQDRRLLVALVRTCKYRIPCMEIVALQVG